MQDGWDRLTKGGVPDKGAPSRVGHDWRAAKIRHMPHESVRFKLQIRRGEVFDTIATIHTSEAAHSELIAALRRGLRSFEVEHD